MRRRLARHAKLSAMNGLGAIPMTTSLEPIRGPMRASAVAPLGSWSDKPHDVVVLGFEDRHRRRLSMRGVHGTAFLLDLPEAIVLRGGDALVLEDGGLVEVVAAPEPLVEITGASEATTVRIAWHLGNRHLPVQLVGRRLRIRRDHVIEAMVEGLGGRLRPIEAPFDPEGGAYAGAQAGHQHGDHEHGGHAHSHG